MAFRNNGLRAIALAGLIGLAGTSIHAAPVAAVDPTPAIEAATSSPVDLTPTPAPADPTPTPAPAGLGATPTPALVTPAPAISPPRPRPVPSLGAAVVRIAVAQRGKRYHRGSVGPRAFDCSGLVRYAYRHAGVSRLLGGGHSARAMYRWARLHHRTSRSNPRVGDVVIYGGGSHAAIYIGHGRVVSALNPRQGIRITRLHALGARFTAFIHTRF